MAKRFDVFSPRPKRDGGTHWHKVGSAWEGDKGINIAFDSLPLPDKDGRVSVSLFEPRDNHGQRGGGAPRQQRNDDLDDDTPFIRAEGMGW